MADAFGGLTCHVHQRHYGHRASKATWLYAVRCVLPDLRWGRGPEPTATVGGCTSNADGTFTRRKRGAMNQREANTTPIAFRDILIEMARSVR